MTNDKLEHMLPNREFWATRDKEDNQIVHPFDFDFIFGTETNPLDKPKYALPDPHDPLFVVKPVGRYVKIPFLIDFKSVLGTYFWW